MATACLESKGKVEKKKLSAATVRAFFLFSLYLLYIIKNISTACLLLCLVCIVCAESTTAICKFALNFCGHFPRAGFVYIAALALVAIDYSLGLAIEPKMSSK